MFGSSHKKLDSAIIESLHIDPVNTKISVSGYGKISITRQNHTRHYFLKTSYESDMEDTFEGEYLALNSIHSIVPSLCPSALAYGRLKESLGNFLATDYLDRSNNSGPEHVGSGLSLGEKLAKLHSAPAPVPQGQATPVYGFPVPTFCGPTSQPNSYRRSWKDFFVELRLRFIRDACVANHGLDQQLTDAIDRTVETVASRLLGDDHLGGNEGIKPVLVHGDLWSGNHFSARIGGQGGVEEVIFDPSACYAHSEYELGIMKMFGGYGSHFWTEYHRFIPKTAPEQEYDDRIKLYELYHQLNHYSLFGGGYRSTAMGIMNKLCRKYGSAK